MEAATTQRQRHASSTTTTSKTGGSGQPRVAFARAASGVVASALYNRPLLRPVLVARAAAATAAKATAHRTTFLETSFPASASSSPWCPVSLSERPYFRRWLRQCACAWPLHLLFIRQEHRGKKVSGDGGDTSFLRLFADQMGVKTIL
jgi:hypothetical protein